jgi:Ca-activated chloride channel family protein
VSTEEETRMLKTLLKTLILLALIWNVLVPALAQETDRPGTGELLWKSPGGLVSLPVLDIAVDLEVTGILVHGTVTQSFRNPTSEVIECLYVFPLPERAAVSHMEMRIGPRRIVSVIKEREEARKTYDKARQEGRKAALLDQERPNLFTTSAAGINPGETVEVRLEYLEEASYDDGTFGLSFPLTFTPRFSTGGAADGARVTSPCVRRGSASLPRARIVVRLDAGVQLRKVESESHALETWWDGGVLVAKPSGETVAADRDFLLSWRPFLGPAPLAALFTEDREDGKYMLMMLLPPVEGMGAGRGLPTETLFVLDVSGSMDGPSIQQARTALLAALDRLRPGDTFDILTFNQDVREFRPAFVPAGGPDLEEARRFVRDLRADGGTRIDVALDRALAKLGTPLDDRVQRLIFLTDGAVDNEDAILRDVRARLGQARLHALGIGSAPNRYLMRKMAAEGRGTCEFISSSASAENRVEAFLARLDRPVMTGLTLEWDGVESPDAYPSPLPDLHAGEPLYVSARIGGGGSVRRVTLHGRTLEGPVSFDLRAEDAGTGDGVATRWARARVESLMDTLHENADPESVRRAVIGVSIPFGIVTRYTSLVAVEEFPTVTGDTVPVRVASALPFGSTPAGELPQGGTDEPFLLMAGLLLVLFGSLFFIGARRPA